MNQFRGHTASQLRSMQKEIAVELERSVYEDGRSDIPMAGQQESQGGTYGTANRLRTVEEALDDVFTFYDSPEAVPHYVEVREAAKVFAKVVARHAPSCADQVLAVQYIRQAVMFANAAIALDGRSL